MTALHIAIPSVTRTGPLVSCAVDALARTLTEPAEVWIVENTSSLLGGEVLDVRQGSYINGRKLDAVVAALPPDAEWFFAMHEDAAPVSPRWWPWLMAHIGDHPCAGFFALERGPWPHPLGALFRVAWLREHRVSFRPVLKNGEPGWRDVGNNLPAGTTAALAALPLGWSEAMGDLGGDPETGEILWRHLGGGSLNPPDSARHVEWASRIHQTLLAQGL